jgi:D-glycero-D-manno-heptose 1,7-bisphosphate phosphatase
MEVSGADPRLVVLDRDGVINRDSDDFIKTPDEWQPLPGSLEAIASLCDAGFRVVVATNQSGVGRGLFDAEMLELIHRKMIDGIQAAGGELQGIFVCPHHPDENCDCRKPKPGLLRQIEQSLSQSLAGLPVIGDSKRDLDAAAAAGANGILVRTGNGVTTEKSLHDTDNIAVFDDLADAARALIHDAASNSTG